MTLRNPLRIRVERNVLPVAALAWALAGCHDQAAPLTSGDPPAELRNYVTGAAAQSIDSRGLFQFPQPAAPGEVPIISPERAGQLALAYIKTWNFALRRPLESDRGAPIDFDHLQVGRTFLARTAFGPVPDGFHPAFRNMYGPYYLVTLLAGREPVLIISVAAYATYERIDERGFLMPQVRHGAEFDHAAIARTPHMGIGFVPVLPEQAVARVSRATGARASHVPELVLRADPMPPRLTRAGMWAPAQALWKVRLDREIPVRATARGGRRVNAREILVGAFDHMYIPAETQLKTERIEARLLGDSISEGRPAILELPILEPIAFETVVADQPEKAP
jgi:hypothetical protein